MRGFKFKLQPVLDQRQKKEDILKKELAEKKLLFEQEKIVTEGLKSKLSDARQEFRDKQKDHPKASEAASYILFFDRVEREIEFQIMKLTELVAEVNKAQERLMEAMKEKKIIEKLRDKQIEEYQAEVNRQEQVFIDEISTVRYRRVDI
jgi:flagellar protein FliJ